MPSRGFAPTPTVVTLMPMRSSVTAFGTMNGTARSVFTAGAPVPSAVPVVGDVYQTSAVAPVRRKDERSLRMPPLAQVVLSDARTLFPLLGAANATADVPFPRMTLLAVSVLAPVPPFPTGRMPVTAADCETATAPKAAGAPAPGILSAWLAEPAAATATAEPPLPRTTPFEAR